MHVSKFSTKNYSFISIFIIILPMIPQNYPLLLPNFLKNGPFYCNFGLKMLEKMRKYKEFWNNNKNLKMRRNKYFFEIFLKEYPPLPV